MTIKDFLIKFNRCTAQGWLTQEEALLLVNYAEKTEGPMVEVGSYFGRSAMLLAQLEDTEFISGSTHRRLLCIDPWDDQFSTDHNGDWIFKAFQENVQRLNKLVPIDVVPLRMRIEDWTPDRSYEFVYLDGSHTYLGTRSQIEKALLCTPKIIAIHDVNDSGEGAEVKRASLEMLGPWKERMGRLAVWNGGMQ